MHEMSLPTRISLLSPCKRYLLKIKTFCILHTHVQGKAGMIKREKSSANFLLNWAQVAFVKILQIQSQFFSDKSSLIKSLLSFRRGQLSLIHFSEDLSLPSASLTTKKTFYYFLHFGFDPIYSL